MSASSKDKELARKLFDLFGGNGLTGLQQIELAAELIAAYRQDNYSLSYVKYAGLVPATD